LHKGIDEWFGIGRQEEKGHITQDEKEKRNHAPIAFLFECAF